MKKYICEDPEGETGQGDTLEEAFDNYANEYVHGDGYRHPTDCTFYSTKELKVIHRLKTTITEVT